MGLRFFFASYASRNLSNADKATPPVIGLLLRPAPGYLFFPGLLARSTSLCTGASGWLILSVDGGGCFRGLFFFANYSSRYLSKADCYAIGL